MMLFACFCFDSDSFWTCYQLCSYSVEDVNLSLEEEREEEEREFRSSCHGELYEEEFKTAVCPTEKW